MMPLLGNVVENKKIPAYESSSQDHYEDCACKVRSDLTNKRVAVEEELVKIILKSLESSHDIVPSNKNRTYDSSVGLHTYESFDPVGLRRPELCRAGEEVEGGAALQGGQWWRTRERGAPEPLWDFCRVTQQKTKNFHPTHQPRTTMKMHTRFDLIVTDS